MDAKSLRDDRGNFMDNTGRLLTLCAIHEVGPFDESAQAAGVIMGLSVCQAHMHAIYGMKMRDLSERDILRLLTGKQIKDGVF